ncbi:lipopolysaccharide kinase InaA family protein [Methylovorus menthalis]|uniref:lipopolysaccharide kinase InaA family protein n=1 Tax=Methylovorus menthalis TaxID=1002227 RepID=UPI001E40CFD2|nr:lipopolysaccharide kinase InaA family protein [Methylovorus menthalis]MCB4811278.1 lipopolysaccharide kinase InaA family protein [Methylovorus menthalis]
MSMAINIALAPDTELLLADGSSLRIGQHLRVLPGRRLVCFGEWQGQPVLAKVFMGKRAAYYAERDANGVKRLLEAHLATPPLLVQTSSQAGDMQVLLYVALMGAGNAEQAMQAADASGRSAITRQLVEAVAAQHEAGLLQTDMYPKNFLLEKGTFEHSTVHAIDGDGIRPLGRLFSSWRAWHNLAVLLAKLDPEVLDRDLPALVQRYREVRQLGAGPVSPLLRRLIDACRWYASYQYADKKVLRTCSDVVVHKTSALFAALNRQPPMTLLAVPSPVELDGWISQVATAEALKRGNTSTVVRHDLDNVPVVIKRYNIKNFWHGIGRAWRQSRAAVSWRNGFRLQRYGIGTPKPLALVEARWGPFRRRAYLLAEYLDAPDVGAYFEQADLSDDDCLQACRQIARMFYQLKLLKISHGDCKASNLKMVNTMPYLIDLDSMQEHLFRHLFAWHHARDLRRFMRNWPPQSRVYRMLAHAFADIYRDAAFLKKAGISIN